MEILVVMTIMVILLGVGYSAYASFTETMKFNQDIADLQSDILIIQRASMLLERKPGENWVYGLGIDFSDVRSGKGEYTFFKWCSEFTDFGPKKTKGVYPAHDPDDLDGPNNGYLPGGDLVSECINTTTQERASLTAYGKGVLNLKEKIEILGPSNPGYLVFESVSGRAFLYDTGGVRIDGDIDMEILFNKNFGLRKVMIVENLTGRTKIKDYITP